MDNYDKLKELEWVKDANSPYGYTASIITDSTNYKIPLYNCK